MIRDQRMYQWRLIALPWRALATYCDSESEAEQQRRARNSRAFELDIRTRYVVEPPHLKDPE